MKSQDVRLLDVFVLGPFMVYVGATRNELPDWQRFGLLAAGVGTIVYNGRNYLERERVANELDQGDVFVELDA